MSLADWDEIGFLAEFTKASLPAQAVTLAKGNFPNTGSEQASRCERILRSVSLESEFGEITETQTSTVSEALMPTFELDVDDKARVFDLSSKMRKIVFASAVFDDAHKRRLLDRISAIENEVKQPKGRLDVILGGVSDVGDTLKKFGQDLKPLSDRMSEIKRITQRNSDQYEQIPAPEEIEALPSPQDFEDPEE